MAVSIISPFSTSLKFTGAQKPPESPRITVWNPPYYDPAIFAQEPDTESKRRSTALFERYNKQVPIVKAAAEDLCRKLLKKKDLPAATLYPCPNPMAVNDITIEIPLGPGSTDADKKAAAEPNKTKMLDVLRTVKGMTISADGETKFYTHQSNPFAVHLITEMTEEEALKLDAYS
jgi:hypothetical protein